MKILQLCHKPPFPAVDGGTMAMSGITQGLLSQGHEVKVLSLCSDKHPVRDTCSGLAQATAMEWVKVDLTTKPLDAAVALLCGESYNVKRFVSSDFKHLIAKTLNNDNFDIVHLESIFMAPYIEVVRSHSKARIVLRSHNVEHRIWQQIAASTRRGPKRWYLKHLALTLRAYELERMNMVDGIACITDADARTFKDAGIRKPLTVIPFGIEVKPLPTAPIEQGSIYHIGAMDWMPNQDGVRWLVNDVWPLLHEAAPGMRLHLAGRHMPEWLLALQRDGISVEGEVDDAASFIANKQINIVPLLAGSGMRIKIIEAMSMGKVVISTTVGASGIDCRDGEHLLIADTPQQMAECLLRCNANPELCSTLSLNARRLVETHYNRDLAASQIVAFYEKLT